MKKKAWGLVIKTVIIAFAVITSVAGACAAAVSFDFDGDGVSDPVVYAPRLGLWYVLSSESGGVEEISWGWNETRPVPGDYDGDGITDFAVYHRQTGYWYIHLSSTQSLWAFNWGWNTGRPVSADFDGDGKSNPAIYDRETGYWYVLLEYGAKVKIAGCGWPDARPVPGDYDGDGISDFAVYHRQTGDWYVLSSSTGALESRNFGWRGARPVPGDYDGNGRANFAVYHRAGGEWYILCGETNDVMRVEKLGGPEYEPAPGDYDGDGITDIAVYHRKTGVWTIRLSSGGEDRQFTFGWNETTPLPAYKNGGCAGLTILSFGDSITYGQGSSSDGPETGYPRLLEWAMEPYFGGHCASVNAGVPGETTVNGMKRLAAALQLYNPDVLLLMEGTNDHFFKYSYDQIESRLRQMVVLALQNDIDVVIATIPPVITNDYRNRTEQHARIRAFNPRIYAIAADYGIRVAQVYEFITSQPGWEADLMDQPTANHPNDAGYRFVEEAFFTALAEGVENGEYY